ncbi:hypothetical protein KQX54_019654 [Cotesia glomerata]|uniref:Uncharacterized protein n=1 Tax=Cotesia glomerata TaxID=32391 RepID=A0AAV7IFK5_COTGL|nr:hypothetical protein KQX54_019654 [Cotesia glomerata]
MRKRSSRYVCQSAMQPLSSGIIEVMSELRTCHKIYQECRRSETVLKGDVQIKGQKTFENAINLHRFRLRIRQLNLEEMKKYNLQVYFLLAKFQLSSY